MLLLFFFSPCDEAHKRQPSPLLNFLFVKAGGVTSRCVTEWLIDFFTNWFKPHISYVTFIFKAGPRLSRWKINWSSLYVSLPVRRSVGRVEDYGKGGGCADVHSWLRQVRSSVNWPRLLLATVWVRRLYQTERKGNHGGLQDTQRIT